MNDMSFFRPFELLKLIRDQKIRNIDRFAEALYDNGMYLAAEAIHGWQEGLQKLGLIDVNDKHEIGSTDQLSQFFKVVRLSLTELTNYSSNSIVCSPIFGTPSRRSVKSDIFVVMPFLKELEPIYDVHIQNTTQKIGLSVFRGDDFFTAQSVMSDIWNAMHSCRIVIADCTGKNANVFYEIGMAHTLGKPVILISQSKDDIPFDIQHLRFLIYEFTQGGMSEFEKTLETVIKSVLQEEFSYEKFLD